MHRIRTGSAPDLGPVADAIQEGDDSALNGVAAHVKLLLKLIHDHKDATNNNRNDGRKMLRVATMMTILDNVRSRIQKYQFRNKRSEAELRRCNSNSDLMPRHVARDCKAGGECPVADEKERLKKALNASLAARKSLEIMCTGLGKEKEIMSIELAKRIHLMNEMEELISDLKTQNQSLLEKVRECASEHRDKRGGTSIGTVGETQGNAALQERNKVLSEHLQRALDGYRSMKKKAKELHEENMIIRAIMEETGEDVRASLERLHRFKESIASGTDPPMNIEEEIARLEQVVECFERQVMKQNQKKVECVKPKGEINACATSIFA